MVDATPSVAVLYSGRWCGPLMQPWVQNHLDHLILPYRASVFLVTSSEFWCSDVAVRAAAVSNEEASRMLQEEVRGVFGASVETHAALIDEPVVDGKSIQYDMHTAIKKQDGDLGTASPFKVHMMLNFRQQFLKLAAADALRRSFGASHRIVVRARLDVLFQYERAVPIGDMSIGPGQVYAKQFAGNGFSFHDGHYVTSGGIGFHDWLYVTSEEGMAAIANAAQPETPLIFNQSRRCYNFCVEEQIQTQLAARGYEGIEAPGGFHVGGLLPLDAVGWNLSQVVRVGSLDPAELELLPSDGSCGCLRFATEVAAYKHGKSSVGVADARGLALTAHGAKNLTSELRAWMKRCVVTHPG